MLSLLLASFVTFFVAIDPVAMAPMFTTMTSGMTPEWRRKMAIKSVAIASGILLAFAFGGAWLLEQIHVSMDAFRIAGGLLLFLIAVDMLFEKRAERRDERAEKVAQHQAEHPEHQDDISVFPLAIPLIAGPGAIASIMLFFAQYEGALERTMVLLGVGINLALCLGAFLLAGPISKVMGPTVGSMLTRVFGILLAALAAQFVVDGVRNAFGIGA
ncbi:MarC family protein [Vitreimonas flagellata]|uniref:MarC family protein n=1 Tax=Vitreimonas flagellata TaxID=2560861 RepID=UPI001074A8C6|nr:MarC family protein [Vitreimonas flagellata]